MHTPDVSPARKVSSGFRIAAMALLATAAVPVSPPASAHHGWAWAEDQQSTLNGKIQSISMSAPHPTLQITDAAGAMWGPVGGILIAAGAVVSTFGTLNGFTLLTGQVPYGAALDRVFPPRMGQLSRYGTPANALVFSNLLASILVAMNFAQGLVGAFNTIILLAVMSSLLPYALCALAELMIMLRTGRTVAGPGIVKVAILGGLGFLYAMWALYGAGANTVFLGFMLIVAGIPIHVWIKWQNARSGAARTREREV